MMKNLKMKTGALKILLLVLLSGLVSLAASAQTVSKLADLVTGQDQFGTGFGPSTPQCRFTLVGTNLWFTGNAGGAAGAGGVFSFDLSTSNVTQLATFDNSTGKNPWAASIAIADGKGWFTTSVGGTGNKGSLCSIDLATYAVSNVYSFPTNDYLTSFNGQSPHSTPVQIGGELWFTCSAGGLASAFGTITKYNLTNGTVTDAFKLDGTTSGRQPLGSSLVSVGSNAWYYLTFAGGTNIAGGTPNGAGVLGKLTFNNLNQPVLTTVTNLTGRFISFPAGDPVFDGTNFLYFTTAGVSTNPGAIVRYSLGNGTLTSLFNFVSNAVATTNFGKQPYGTPVLYNHELYFTTLSGGTTGKGILGKLSLSNNVVTKLADFEGATGLALGASPQYNGGTVFTNPVDGRIGIYFPINKGGLNNNNGTIVRVNLPPPPIVARLRSADGGEVQLSWTGGYSPFNVDAKFSALSGAWTTNWLPGLNTNVVTFPATNSDAFFRVQGASE